MSLLKCTIEYPGMAPRSTYIQTLTVAEQVTWGSNWWTGYHSTYGESYAVVLSRYGGKVGWQMKSDLFVDPRITDHLPVYNGFTSIGARNFLMMYPAMEGMKITLENGSYIVVTDVTNTPQVQLTYYTENGAQAAQTYYNGGSITSDTFGSVVCIPWYNGDPSNPDLAYFEVDYADTAYNIFISGYSSRTKNTAALKTFFTGLEPIDEDNPYAPGGTSDETELPPGNFSDDSDDVEEDIMPSLSAVGTGMATIFSPTNGQLKSLSDVFWGANWWQALQNTIEGIDKMFVSLGIVPFSVTKGSTVEVTWLGLPITEVQLTLAAQQFYEFDMGTIDLSNDTRIFTSGSALDYSPFSRLGIYLPFIGFQDLDIDECRGTTINVKYRIDILSGTCIALIKIGGNTIYQFTGNCVTQIPITSQNFENLFTNAVNVGIAFGVSRNAAAVASAGEAATAEMVQTGKMSATAAALDATQRSARVSGANASLGNATANAMMGMKPDFNKTGSVSASASLLAVKQPFLYLKTPRQCLPEHYQRYCGFPSNITGQLSEFSGYTVVEDIRLNGLVATSGEVEEIYDLLKSGIII